MLKNLDLERIRDCSPALSKSWSEARFEAAIFCLNYNGHTSNIECEHTGNRNKYKLLWVSRVTDTIKRTCHDIQEATEHGAEGMAALFTKELTPYEMILRSTKRTGFDYWLGNLQNDTLIYQQSARLEISGLIRGSNSEFCSRIKNKKKQTEKSLDTKLPAYVAIIDFGTPRIAFEKV
jgi:hypothetical protein